jgi:membrane-associated phospholipid phosphatase
VSSDRAQAEALTGATGVSTQAAVTAGAVGLVVAVASSAVASSGTVGVAEAWSFHAINDLPDALRWPMWGFQLAGLLAVPGLVAVVALSFRRWRLAAALVVLIPLKLFIEKVVIKQLVERERPGTTVCELDVTCGSFRDVPLRGLSFVSGHAIIAWAVATLLWTALPGRWRFVPFAVATANAIARVYLGAHNPLDVVGGGGVGVALGALLAVVFGLTRRPNGDLPASLAPVPQGSRP